MDETNEQPNNQEVPAGSASAEGAPAAESPEKLRAALAEANDRYLRLYAEFDNVRKRHAREREELIRYAHEEVIVELLGFFEDFERCLEAARKNPSEAAALVAGLEMVMKRMRELLRKYEVEEISAAGQPFNHEAHEALLTAPAEGQADGTVLEVFQKGYRLGGRVVRTAKVKVVKNDA